MDKQKRRMLVLIRNHGYYVLCAIRDISSSYHNWYNKRKPSTLVNEMIYNLKHTACMFEQYLMFREYYKSYNKYLKETKHYYWSGKNV